MPLIIALAVTLALSAEAVNSRPTTRDAMTGESTI